MRRRLIQSTLAVVLVVIAVFGVSLVLVEARTIESSAKESVDSEAVRLIGIVESRMIGEERISREVLAQQIAPGGTPWCRSRGRSRSPSAPGPRAR